MWFRKKNPEPELKRPLVVVVDDERDLCLLVQIALEARGLGVASANDGATGLDLIRAQRPDLILLDIKMPRMNGYQVLARLQQDPALSAIPVIVLTSLTDESDNSDEEWTRRLGVSQFISKPANTETIVEAIVGQLGLVQSAALQTNSSDSINVSLEKIDGES